MEKATNIKKIHSFWYKKAILCAIFILAGALCEIVTFLMMGIGFLPKYFIIDFAILLFIAGVIFVIPHHLTGVVLAGAVFLAQCVIGCVNLTVYKMLGDVFTVDLLISAGQATEAFSMSKINWIDFVPFAALLGLMLAAEILVLVKVKNEKFACEKKSALVLASIFAAFCIVSPFAAVVQAATLPTDTTQTAVGVSVKENYKKMSFKLEFFQLFGTFTLYYHNILLRKEPGSILQERSVTETKQEFDSADAAFKSEYFGIDEGNNVIIVMTESFDRIFVNEKYTPTMYRLLEEGVHFAGYHTNNNTSVSEAIGILGNYPEKDNLVAEWNSGSSDNIDSRNPKFAYSFPFSTPNVLRQNGYEQCNYFIAHNKPYYSRQYTHKNYGFDNIYFNESYPVNVNFSDYSKYTYSWTMPERYFLNSALEDFMPTNKRFFSYMSFINPHLPYDKLEEENSGRGYSRQFFNQIDDSDFKDVPPKVYLLYKNALAKAMVADDGIKYMLEQLEVRGLADNTTILFYTDHNAYGDDLAFLMRGTGKKMPESYNLPASIWSPNLKGVTVDKFVNTFDLVPTLYDLLGVDINPKMYLGVNAFGQEDSVVISKLGGMVFNDKIFSYGGPILYETPDATAEDLQRYQESYKNTINKWSYINRLFMPENEAYFLSA